MSRHAATPSRRGPRSADLPGDGSPSVSVSVAELVARYRATNAANAALTAPVTPGGPMASSITKPVRTAPTHPVLAAELVSRYAPAIGVENAPGGRRRHAMAVPTGSGNASGRTLGSLFAHPVPIKVVARPALVLAAVVATVAVIDAGSASTSTASSTQNAAAQARPGSIAAAAASTATTAASTATAAESSTSLHRVSRDVRARTTVPLVHLKPGQTVPGVWVKPNLGPETSCFCMRWGTMHEGIDLAGPLGSPILAAGDGVVIQAGPNGGFGNSVQIRHANGDVTLYGHMRYFFVQVGQHVVAGQKIALVGNEGDSTGPHLHFGVHPADAPTTWIDPAQWLKARGVSVGPYDPNG